MITYAEFTRRTGIKVTINHNGKMEGMQSLSTCCESNKYCQKRFNEICTFNYSQREMVCIKCYANRMMKMYKNLKNSTDRNLEYLSKVLDVNDLPDINVRYFRFESFGDLDNENQFINYLNICRKNPRTKFAIWTKNPWIIQNVFDEGYKKPKNLNIVLSSLYINKVDEFKYDWVDRVFTVYDKKYIEENDVDINCGGRKCLECLKCYKKSNKYYYINEQLK